MVRAIWYFCLGMGFIVGGREVGAGEVGVKVFSHVMLEYRREEDLLRIRDYMVKWKIGERKLIYRNWDEGEDYAGWYFIVCFKRELMSKLGLKEVKGKLRYILEGGMEREMDFKLEGGDGGEVYLGVKRCEDVGREWRSGVLAWSIELRGEGGVLIGGKSSDTWGRNLVK